MPPLTASRSWPDSAAALPAVAHKEWPSPRPRYLEREHPDRTLYGRIVPISRRVDRQIIEELTIPCKTRLSLTATDTRPQVGSATASSLEG